MKKAASGVSWRLLDGDWRARAAETLPPVMRCSSFCIFPTGIVWGGGEGGSGGREKEVSLGDGEGSVGSVAQSGSFLWEAAKAIRRVATIAGPQ